MKYKKQPAKFRQLTVEQLDGRDLPSTTSVFPDAHGLISERVIVRFLDAPTTPAFADAIVPLGAGYYRVDLRPGVDAAEALRFYATQPNVAEAMPDSIIAVARTTNDPMFSSQWSLAKAGVTTAWNSTTGTGHTLVAVIDTGVDYSHPDLAANIFANSREIAGNGLDDDGNGYIDDLRGYDFANNDNNPMDDDGHGTHVAGIIGAVGGNAIGVSGVNMRAKILPLKFLKADGTGYTSDAVRALNYAVGMGAKIVNLSWGGGAYNSALASAITNARNAGVIIVAAAGNNGANSNTTPFYPASYSGTNSNMIVVGASTSTDGVASYSNYGSTAVTLFAPGSSIVSLKPGSSYTTLSGTSMAAPFVTGALSLLWDYHPTWSTSQILAKLRTSVDSLAAFNGLSQTNGRINVAKLLDATSPPATPTTPVTPPVSPPVVPPASPPATTAPIGTRTGFASTSGPLAIADFGTVTMPITITSNISITDIDVGLSITHGYVGDLTIRLIAPDGTIVLLANRRGGSGNNFTSTLFSDQATASVTTAAAPFSGSMKAEGSLGTFNGRNAKGTWKLSVTDNAYYDTGTLTAFTLYVTGTSMTTQTVRKQAFAEAMPMRLDFIAPFAMRNETRSLLGHDTIQV